MDNDNLILGVENHQIYGTSDIFYKDNMKKEKPWMEIPADLWADGEFMLLMNLELNIFLCRLPFKLCTFNFHVI